MDKSDRVLFRSKVLFCTNIEPILPHEIIRSKGFFEEKIHGEVGFFFFLKLTFCFIFFLLTESHRECILYFKSWINFVEYHAFCTTKGSRSTIARYHIIPYSSRSFMEKKSFISNCTDYTLLLNMWEQNIF